MLNQWAQVGQAGLAFLVAARVLGLVWTAPGWAGVAVGARIRICLAALLAVVVLPGAEAVGLVAPLPPIADWLGWSLAIGVELLIGGVLGLSAGLVVSAARQGGDLVGVQAGLSPMALLDVEASGGLVGDGEGGGVTALGQLYGWLALVVFLCVDGPLALVDALGRSFHVIAPGLAWGDNSALHSTELAREVFARMGGALQLTLQIAAPAGVATLLAGLALATISRMASARPLAGLAWPLRSAAGIAISGLSIVVLLGTLSAASRAWGLGF